MRPKSISDLAAEERAKLCRSCQKRDVWIVWCHLCRSCYYRLKRRGELPLSAKREKKDNE